MEIDAEALINLSSAVRYKRNTLHLKYFSNDVRMEMLLIIWLHEPNESIGISDYINTLSTAPKTDSSMQLFVREMIELECFVVTKCDKASRKHLLLGECLKHEAQQYFSILLQVIDTTASEAQKTFNTKETPLPHTNLGNKRFN